MMEYHVHTASNWQTLQVVLDDHARKGWKLHTCVFETDLRQFTIVFERPKDGGRQLHDYHGPG